MNETSKNETIPISTKYAYVTNHKSNTVSVCKVENGTGLLSTCTNAKEIFAGPIAVTISGG